MQPKVSVIIPTYNRAEELRRCLGSLINQTFKDFEVLVCDDGSTDHTSSVVGEFSGHLNVVYNRDANFGGPARPRNRGIGLARGEYLAFLDSDDWWAPEKLQISIASLEDTADIVFHDLWLVLSQNQKRPRRKVKSYQPGMAVYADLLIRGNALPTSSVVVRRSVIHEIGGFSEDKQLISTEDFDAWLRIAKKTNRFKRIDSCLGYYWAGGGNLTEMNVKQAHRYKYVYERHLGNLTEKERERASATLAYMIGRTYQLCGRNDEAHGFLRSCLFGNSPIIFRVKSLVLLIAYRFYNFNAKY